MRKIKEVLRLKHEAKLSNRAIARSCNICHKTVKRYLKRAKKAGLSWPLPEGMDDEALERMLFPEAPQATEIEALIMIYDLRTMILERSCPSAPAEVALRLAEPVIVSLLSV